MATVFAVLVVRAMAIVTVANVSLSNAKSVIRPMMRVAVERRRCVQLTARAVWAASVMAIAPVSNVSGSNVSSVMWPTMQAAVATPPSVSVARSVSVALMMVIVTKLV